MVSGALGEIGHVFSIANTVSYFQEMARVVQDGGWVVFDIMTESCFNSHHIKAWLDANPWHWPWAPHLITKDFTIKFFVDRGIDSLTVFPYPSIPRLRNAWSSARNHLNQACLEHSQAFKTKHARKQKASSKSLASFLP